MSGTAGAFPEADAQVGHVRGLVFGESDITVDAHDRTAAAQRWVEGYASRNLFQNEQSNLC